MDFMSCVASRCPRRARANVMQAFGNTWGLVPEGSLKKRETNAPALENTVKTMLWSNLLVSVKKI